MVKTVTYFDLERTKIEEISYTNEEGELHNEDGPALIIYPITGEKITDVWYTNGMINRLDGPAKIEYYEDGQIYKEEWYSQGEYHRENGPAIIEYFPDGKIELKDYLINGKKHREDGPAEEMWNENGIKELERWFLDGEMNRIGGPANIIWNPDGSLMSEEWWVNGKNINSDKDGPIEIGYENNIVENKFYLIGDLTKTEEYDKSGVLFKINFKDNDHEYHNENGPAYIRYYDDGKINKELYYRHGDLHRIDGPAEIVYFDNGKNAHEKWYINGVQKRTDDQKKEPVFKQYWKTGKNKHREYMYDDIVVTQDYYENGQLREETWKDLNQFVHRGISSDGEQKPAGIMFNGNGTLIHKLYFIQGKKHRDNGPAALYYENGELSREEYCIQDKLHRDDGPAMSIWIVKSDGRHKRKEAWYTEGELNRQGGPAVTMWHLNGSILQQEWYHFDQLHNRTGPASIYIDKNGYRTEQWYAQGELHRVGGPAYIEWEAGDEEPIVEKWFLNGKEVAKPASAIYFAEVRTDKKIYHFIGDSLENLYSKIKKADPPSLPKTYVRTYPNRPIPGYDNLSIFLYKENYIIGYLFDNTENYAEHELEDEGGSPFDEEEYNRFNKSNDCYLERCRDPYDLFLKRDFTDADDIVYFFEFDENDKYVTTHCLNKESLKETFKDREQNILGLWVKNHGRVEEIEGMGFGGHADSNVLFLYLDIKGRSFLKIKDHGPEFKFRFRKRLPAFKMKYAGTARLGNLKSEFGVSEFHGQLPPENIYDVELVKFADLPKLFEECKSCKEKSCDEYLREENVKEIEGADERVIIGRRTVPEEEERVNENLERQNASGNLLPDDGSPLLLGNPPRMMPETPESEMRPPVARRLFDDDDDDYDDDDELIVFDYEDDDDDYDEEEPVL